MGITIKNRIGYGYVEPNFLSAPRTGQVRGDKPMASGVDVLMNGQFVKRDATDTLTFAAAATDPCAAGMWMVFNEEKLYDERKQMHRDYAMKADQFTNGVMVPRTIKLVSGDSFTTNCIAGAETSTGVTLAKGDYLEVQKDTGLLVKKASGTSSLVVVKEFTMPDGQNAVKVEVL